MSMSNDGFVGRTLDVPTSGGAHPLTHLVLSGHTHFLFQAMEDCQPSLPYLCLHQNLETKLVNL
jgi:hypothetical protein